jgi:threonylcarbamoyladenosine tRNA methylthiotransferase MtaB
MKIYLDSIGCRLNQAEIEQYARQFRAAGHTLVAGPSQADLAVVNTCAVTAAAVSDSRHKIRQIERSGTPEIIATGCWATLKPAEAGMLPGVAKVVVNFEKDELVSNLLQIQLDDFDLEPIQRQPIPGLRQRTRAFIKVQDGCDNHCTFCITTIARGPGRSRPIQAVLADIRAAEVAREVVLTGVHLGSWGQDFDVPSQLKDLVAAILSETDIPRVRLSSLEPWDLDESFFELWENSRVCRHLHLPLQSGSAGTLRRMSRKTTPESFAALVTMARQAIPEVAITTDVITGFPGETEQEFEESLDFVREIGFAGGHVFSYSARPGTAATRLPQQVPNWLSKERNARLRSILQESAERYQSRFIGKVLPVLWESAITLDAQGWEMSGLTGNYLRVRASTPHHIWNQITPVRLSEARPDGLFGQIQIRKHPQASDV